MIFSLSTHDTFLPCRFDQRTFRRLRLLPFALIYEKTVDNISASEKKVWVFLVVFCSLKIRLSHIAEKIKGSGTFLLGLEARADEAPETNLFRNRMFLLLQIQDLKDPRSSTCLLKCPIRQVKSIRCLLSPPENRQKSKHPAMSACRGIREHSQIPTVSGKNQKKPHGEKEVKPWGNKRRLRFTSRD